MCLARSGADAALDRVSDLLAKSKTEGSSTIPRVEDSALWSEFDDMQGEFSDFSDTDADDDDDYSDSEDSDTDDDYSDTQTILTAREYVNAAHTFHAKEGW